MIVRQAGGENAGLIPDLLANNLFFKRIELTFVLQQSIRLLSPDGIL